MKPRLYGKGAVVTGGTRGVGRASTLALLGAGAKVVACYRRDDEAAARLRQRPGWNSARCHLVRADLDTELGRYQLLEAVERHLERVDILVNNHGTYAPAALETLAEDELEASLRTNLTGHILVTRALLGVLSDGASIVTVGAAMAERGRPEHVAFTTAKAGLAGFGRALAKELAARRIRVNTVAPGVVETERGLDLPPPVRAGLLSSIALRRFVTADDVANAVLFLASDLSGLVSGATLKVDGGV